MFVHTIYFAIKYFNLFYQNYYTLQIFISVIISGIIVIKCDYINYTRQWSQKYMTNNLHHYMKRW